MEVVLVCGGRDYKDREHVRRVLTKFHEEIGIGLLVHGAAGSKKLSYCAPHEPDSGNVWHVIEGADLFADEWALYNRVPVWPYPVTNEEWRLGKRAGPLRNKRMLDERKPGFCIAFPGGKGTADMVKRCREAGVEVMEV